MDTVGNPKLFNCVVCDKNSPSQSVLNRHMVIHTGEKAYKCKECNKTFGFKSALKSHLKRIHRQERTHKCDYCEKLFVDSKDLKCHTLPYQCEVCNKKSAQSSTHYKHLKHIVVKKTLYVNCVEKLSVNCVL